MSDSRGISPPPGILTDADVDREFRTCWLARMAEFRLTPAPVEPGVASLVTPLPELEVGTTSKAATRRMVIKLGKQGSLDFIASDIFTVDGCTIGFLGLGHHPRVLEVGSDTPMGRQDVREGDALCHVNGEDTRDVDPGSMWQLMADAKTLGFQQGTPGAPSASLANLLQH